MSIYNVMVALRRIHDASGRLRSIKSHLQIFNRALNFNPRDRDNWDLFGLRDNNLTRITHILRRIKRSTGRMERERGYAPNYSRDLNRLFSTWASAHGENGIDSREARQARERFYETIITWQTMWRQESSRAATALRVMRKQRVFYVTQRDLFRDLKILARRIVRCGLIPGNREMALAFMLQFQEISGLSSSIARDYTNGHLAVVAWRRELAAAQRDLRAWESWSSNRRAVQRSVEQGRAPL